MKSAKIAGDGGCIEKPFPKAGQGAGVPMQVRSIQGLNKFDVLSKSTPDKKTSCLDVNRH
jgi:hypothetical protein